MTSQTILSFIAHRLREKGLTQQQIADKSGFKKQNVNRMLKGNIDPRVSTFLKLTEACNIAVTIDGVNIKEIHEHLNKKNGIH